MRPLNIFYIGNFEPPHSTENHLKEALEHDGHTVFPFLERPENWQGADNALSYLIAEGNRPDLVLWTSTSSYAPPPTYEEQQKLLAFADTQQIPTVSYHLDLWFGLNREHEVREKPFFRTNVICTADGGHQDEWFRMGKTHFWFPPAIVESEVRIGTPRDFYTSEIAFVGQTTGYAHRESTHRFELVAHLKEVWGDKVRFWPGKGQPRIDGRELADLYASTKVVVGDSCLVPRLKRYWSDRIPNVTGRGAFLLHPDVEGLGDQHPHLVRWDAGNWFDLDVLIDSALADDDWRTGIARDCMADTLENHTYEVRMKQLVTLLTQKGML